MIKHDLTSSHIEPPERVYVWFDSEGKIIKTELEKKDDKFYFSKNWKQVEYVRVKT